MRLVLVLRYLICRVRANVPDGMKDQSKDSWVKSKVASTACVLLVSGCTLVGIRSGYEQPTYTLVEDAGNGVEIRKYEARLAAQATMGADSEETGRDDAFRLLFDYISGANNRQSDIAMTTPVEVEEQAETISMTAPVETSSTEDSYTMRFFLPASYTSATAPMPNDPRVELIEVPPETLAVLRFSGWRDESDVRMRQEELLRAVKASGWQADGHPTALFYDPPWTLPFFRRNEVAVAVTQPSSGS
ncbi:MAG: heme-binding protein [Pseudomonadota bacterium]